jgi:hypothetical protein
MTTLPLNGQDWTESEQAEIRRQSCVMRPRAGLGISHMDGGDPWCIIYDEQRQRIPLHIARIERQYVVVWREQRVAKTQSVPPSTSPLTG